MAWRLAESLKTLRNQINAQYPNRSKVSDGTIGDTRHSARKSDHNPNAKGVVCAFDITEDHKNGPDLVALLPLLLKDKRTHYAIYEGKIYNTKIRSGAARPYSGANAHSHHLHLSVFQDAKLYDDPTPWAIDAPTAAKAPPWVSDMPKEAKTAVAPPMAATGASHEQTGNKYDPQQAVKFFMDAGWSKFASVALVAGLMWESGGNSKWTINPKAKGDKDKHGNPKSHGAGQWQGPRYMDLLKFATRKGKSSGELEVQLGFVDWELHNTEKRAGALLKAAATLEEANAAAITYWRPSIPHADKRLAIARKLLNG